MGNATLSAILWTAAGLILVLYLFRRRKRKALR